jgi:hypothetical protein
VRTAFVGGALFENGGAAVVVVLIELGHLKLLQIFL